MNNRMVFIRYLNHAGVESIRRIEPLRIVFGTSQWHPEEQWLLAAYCYERQAMRTFALRDVLTWGVENPEELPRGDETP